MGYIFPWGRKKRQTQTLTADGQVCDKTSIVIVDASKNAVKVYLPAAHDYAEDLLHIVCEDATHGIELLPHADTRNTIFDQSAVAFHAKGDSFQLICDGTLPGTWYVTGRYTAQWYA